MASVTDGSSNTIAYSEHLIGGGTTNGFPGANRFSFEGVTQIGGVAIQDPWSIFPQVVQALASCSAFAAQNLGNTSAGDADGGVDIWTGYAGATLFNTIAPPNNPQYNWASCESTTGVTYAHAGVINATSSHPGGCNYCFVDGSVHFLKSSISLQTYWSLGTKSDGEVISADSY